MSRKSSQMAAPGALAAGGDRPPTCPSDLHDQEAQRLKRFQELGRWELLGTLRLANVAKIGPLSHLGSQRRPGGRARAILGLSDARTATLKPATHNALYGGLVFVLQAVGNITVMSLLFLFLVYGTRGGFQRWLEGKPGRVARFSAGALIVAGSFTFFYWAVKLPALFGYGWWPRVPWN